MGNFYILVGSDLLVHCDSKCVEVDGHGVNMLVYIKFSAFLVFFSSFQYHTNFPFYSK